MATKFASPDAVRKRAKSMPDSHVDCRVLGHIPVRHAVNPIKGGGFVEVLKCQRCGREKESVVDRRGFTVGRPKLDYPEGYLLPKGTGQLRSETRAILRVESLKRFSSKGAEISA